MDFTSMKKKNKGTNTAEVLAKRAQEAKGGGFDKDPRYFVPAVDKDGNGLVIMRFLPHAAEDGEEYPDFVTLYSHSFKDATTGQWYIENSRTTLPDPNSKWGQIDPVSEANRAVYAELGKEAGKTFLRKTNRSRKTNYIANVKILKNDLQPETVGGIYLFKFGQTVMDKIIAKTVKDLEDDVAFDAFNMWEGANFRLKMKLKDDFRNYDDSTFDQPAPLHGGDDAKLEEVYKQLYSLSAEISSDKFKSYDELEKRFLMVTTGKAASKAEDVAAKPKDLPQNNVESQESTTTVTKQEPSAPAKSDFFSDDDDIPFMRGCRLGLLDPHLGKYAHLI